MSFVLRSAAVLFVAAGSASAAVVSSGPLTTAIPNDGIGLYVNVMNGSTYSGPSTFPPGPSGSPGFNWDLNLYGATTWTLFWSGSTTSGHDTAQPSTAYGIVGSPGTALAPGATIGASSTFSTSTSMTNLTTGAPVYFGFRFTNEGPTTAASDDTVHYGYAQVQLTNGQPGTLLGYAYESVAGAPITIPVIPEPTSLASLALVGLVGRRRR